MRLWRWAPNVSSALAEKFSANGATPNQPGATPQAMERTSDEGRKPGPSHRKCTIHHRITRETERMNRAFGAHLFVVTVTWDVVPC
jgi:hypothetical protein